MSRFLSYVHNLRGVAILYVIAAHARGSISDWSRHPEALANINIFFDAREGNGTVLFIFISGFLFQHLTSYKYDFKNFVTQRFKYIILPYLILSVPIIILRVTTHFQSLALPADFYEHSVFYQVIYYVVTGTHMAPFWFIAAMALYYLSSPVLRLLDNDKFYKFVFPFIFLAGLFTFRSQHNSNPLLAYLHYLPLYILGMCASFYKEEIVSKGWKLLLPLLVIYIGVTILEVTGILNFPTGVKFETVINERVLIFNAIYLKTVLLCFIWMLILYEIRNRRLQLLHIIGDYSYGLFSMHFVLILATRKLWTEFIGPIKFSVPTFILYLLFIIAISLVTVQLLKKLTGKYSKMLIGS